MLIAYIFTPILTETLKDPANGAVAPADDDDDVLHVPEHSQAGLGSPVSEVVHLPGVEKVEELPVEFRPLAAS